MCIVFVRLPLKLHKIGYNIIVPNMWKLFDHHFIKENLNRKIIQFLFVKLKDQLIYVFTKGKIFNNTIDKLYMIDIYVPTKGGESTIIYMLLFLYV